MIIVDFSSYFRLIDYVMFCVVCFIIFITGRPVIKGLQHNPKEAIFRTVGQTATISMIVKGEKNIKVAMYQEIFSERGGKRELGVMTLGHGDAGFSVSIECRTPDSNKLIFEATNRRGTVDLDYQLLVHGVRICLP